MTKKLFRGSIKWLFIGGGSIFLAALAFLVVFTIRLSQGPVSLQFILPYVEQALTNPDGSKSVRLQDIIIVWGGWKEPFKVHAVNLHVIAQNDDVEVVAPLVSISLSFTDFNRGLLALTRIELENPVFSQRVDLSLLEKLSEPQADSKQKAPNGKALFKQASEIHQELRESIFKDITDFLDDAFLHRLQLVRVKNGRIVFWDEMAGKKWEVGAVQAEIINKEEVIRSDFQAKFSLEKDDVATAFINVELNKKERTLQADMKVENLRPSSIVLTQYIKALRAFDLPMDLSMTVNLGVTERNDRVHVSLRGREGSVDLEALTGDVGIVYPVSALAVEMSLDGAERRLLLDNFLIDLHGPRIGLVGDFQQKEENFSLKADAFLHGVDATTLSRYWPPSAAQHPRAWITENITEGSVSRADAHFLGTLDFASDEILTIDSLTGGMNVENATVSYIKPMTPVKGVSADIVFDQDTMTIISTAGHRGPLLLEKGKIVLTGLSGRDQFADIDMTIAGKLMDGLKAIDEEPLHYATKFGINPEQVSGDVRVELSIAKLPLLSGLKVADIDVKAKVDVADASLKKIVGGMDVTQANATLLIDVQGMNVSGRAVVKGIPAVINGRESFVSNSEFDRRYEIKTTLTEAARKSLGIASPYLAPPYLSGPFDVSALITSKGKKTTIETGLDFKATTMGLAELKWEKKAGSSGTGRVKAVLNGQNLDSIPEFNLSAAGINIKGNAGFSPKGAVQKIALDSFKVGMRTDIQGNVSFRPDGGMTIAVQGNAFDASGFLGGGDESKPTPEKKQSDKKEPLPSMTVSASVGRVWLLDDTGINNLSVSVMRRNQNWESVQVTGDMGQNPLSFSIQPGESGKRNFFASAKDLGALIRAVSGMDKIVGGDAVLSGTIDDRNPMQTSQGILVVKDYRVVRVPLLARILTIATLTGIVDVLQGEGIGFSHVTAPFILEDGLLTLQDARTSGISLGITAKGQIDLDRSMLAIEGTIAPAQIINGILGDVPILGDILVHNKGGGMFASLYYIKGSFSDPSISVNPLSTVTPGILREIFRIFDDGSATKARP